MATPTLRTHAMTWPGSRSPGGVSPYRAWARRARTHPLAIVGSLPRRVPAARGRIGDDAFWAALHSQLNGAESEAR
jgi:hypothetical protein